MGVVPPDLRRSIRSRRGRPDCILLNALAEVCENPEPDAATAIGELDSGGVRGGLSPSVKENRGLRALIRERLRRLDISHQLFPLNGEHALAARELRTVARGLRLLGIHACAVRGTLATCPCLTAFARESSLDDLVSSLVSAAREWRRSGSPQDC
ncbi:hypothetical protein NI17_000640 [Thermobifida halotolerans]|uniref:Uncharacterized protein n=1 Tax=Thermobifida halotolerans TaxID=483545 RepID=A0A399G4Z7_9ACTN|nr:hypothetical protein [Thermobifida halotolerans]UOE19810.1 hypothetical protein NI17_000640 [Thermobifida halotolerans]